jgi:deuterolysin
VYVNYKKSGLTPEMFQTILPGETVTTSVNAAKSYKLAGVTNAKVTAIQGFKYVIGSTAPTALKGMEDCESISSSSVTITPDQSTVAR